ncbi:hypothetical protein MMC08_002109, partial [Hypocenomyce scalaris]|nr:hypothetical protein [Hypocenomyce scalaris]
TAFPEATNMASAAPTRPAGANAGAFSTEVYTNVSAVGAPKVQSGQVLMSRMERMEKEQRDQKSMLSQILGTLQGMAR